MIISKQMKKNYRQTDEYNSLIDDCKAIITERVFNARTEIILAHGQLGQRITTDPIYKKYGRGNQNLIKEIARDMGVSWQEIYRSIQFYEKFGIVSPTGESWGKFKEQKNISWNKIKMYYLPNGSHHKECQHVPAVLCRKCKKFLKEYEL